ncbi:MAG: glycosyltransferase family 4 protein [Paludibacteraceae bacterium]|nr:glycosyltransferase family 4 protein [Paludibacteraceae bacterium]
MNVLFLTMAQMLDINNYGIYTDLMRKFTNQGHNVHIATPLQRRTKLDTHIIDNDNVHILGIKTLNVTKTNAIEQGVGQILLEYQFINAIKKYWNNTHFDLILYSTPPITFTNVIKHLKQKYPTAVTYLLLKDIFPQNALDLGMLTKKGIKGLLYSFFRKKEKELYRISDHIGCMSPANTKYVLEHNPQIPHNKVEIAPNSCDLIPLCEYNRNDILQQYGLPTDKIILIYGGNLGKPQGIPFLIECLKANANHPKCHFVIIGNGTEYNKIKTWTQQANPSSVSLFASLPKEEYNQLASACDVGLIFLDYRFTIPNYPSRLLSYLTQRKPIIAATDKNCDLGYIAEANGFGFWCPSNSVAELNKALEKIINNDLDAMGKQGYQFYLNNYTIQHTYDAIIRHV